MIAILACHISFIQSPFLTKIVGLNFNSNLVSLVKFQLNSRGYEDLACIFVQGGLVLDCICSVKYGAFFTVAKPFLDTRNFFHNFFWYHCFFKMKLNNFLVGSFSNGIGLVIEFHLYSTFTKILESF